MPHQILDMFDTHFHVDISPALANSIIKFVNAFESKDRHPQALNTYMLGIDKVHFLEHDRDAFLSLFNSDVRSISSFIDQQATGKTAFGFKATDFKEPSENSKVSNQMRKMIRDVDAINTKFKVISDPFNLYITYILHQIYIAKIPERFQSEAMLKTLMLLQYKFFSSLVAHRFKFPPDESIMTAMYEGLSGKYDIKIYGTWKNVMMAKAAMLLDKSSIHHDVFEKYDNDKEILYLISDTQTRIRQNLNTITTEYMMTKEKHDKIGSYSSLGSTEEGDTALLDSASMLDNMIVNTYNCVLSTAKFLDDRQLKLVCNMFSALGPAQLRHLLIAFSEYATRMQRTGKAQDTKKIDGIEVYIGPQVFIQNTLQTAYRFCNASNVKFNQPIPVLRVIRDIFSSSRITDTDIQKLRASTNFYVSTLQDSTRETTVSALRIGLVLYLVLTAMRFRG